MIHVKRLFLRTFYINMIRKHMHPRSPTVDFYIITLQPSYEFTSFFSPCAYSFFPSFIQQGYCFFRPHLGPGVLQRSGKIEERLKKKLEKRLEKRGVN